MSQQILHREWVAKAEIHTESDETWVLNYFIPETETESGETLYGLRIEKSSPDGTLYEFQETPFITNHREQALAMATAFAKGSVPPVTLLEMADEWLSELESALV